MDNGLNFSPEVLDWYRAQLEEKFGPAPIIKSPTDADALCRNHDDRNPSLGVDLRQNGKGPKIVLNCRSRGCEYQDILDAHGIESEELSYYATNGKGDEPEGCTVSRYAAAKGLPEDFLRSDAVALEDTEWWGVPATEIPYADEEGEYVLSRYRISLTGGRKVVSKKGDPTMLYGLNRLDDAREAGYVVLGEGESDCHSGWHRGIPILGIPGAKNWKPEWANYLDGIPRILVVVEPDGGGRELWEKISATDALRGRLERLELTV
jgi:putative DNA primase/helicase